MKTTVIFYTNDGTEQVDTDLPISTIIQLAFNGISLSAYETLYQINNIISVDLTEKFIELECEII